MRYLYHATRDRFFQSIRREGIRTKHKKSYRGQVGEELVYLADDPDLAASFVEAADNIPESWEDDHIIVLAVRCNFIDSNKLITDPNMLPDDYGEIHTFAYKNIILPQQIEIMNFEDKRFEAILRVNRLNEKYYYE